MKRNLIVVLFVVLLSGCAEKEQEGSSSIVVTAGGETVSAYRDGEDVTDERLALEEQTETAVSKFLNWEDLEFDMFCMLEQDGMTIEVMVDGGRIRLPVVCRGYNWDGEDGWERFDLR